VSTKFSIGDDAKSQTFLQFDDVSNGGVLDRTHLRRIDAAGLEVLPRFEERSGSHEAADMFGPKWRVAGDGQWFDPAFTGAALGRHFCFTIAFTLATSSGGDP
jgi:hypothetical protein